MKEISIRELHRQTGKWVRSAGWYGGNVVNDRDVPVAKLTPISRAPEVNRFAGWKPLNHFARALAQPVTGTPVVELISDDRER